MVIITTIKLDCLFVLQCKMTTSSSFECTDEIKICIVSFTLIAIITIIIIPCLIFITIKFYQIRHYPGIYLFILTPIDIYMYNIY